MAPSLYDLLNVERDAGDAEIRAAWRAAIADLDPSDRRFRAYNQAAEVLLDPAKRAAYDEELTAREPEPEQTTGPTPVPPGSVRAEEGAPPPQSTADPSPPARGVVPAWLLAGLLVLTLAVAGVAAYVSTTPSDSDVADSTRAAQSAAERAIVPILSYDHQTLEADQEEARAFMTSDYREEYDKLFEVIKQNAPRTGTVVEAEVVASGIVRSGEDRVEVLLFVNRPTTNKQQAQPVIYKDHVRVQLQKVDDEWLVDCLITSPGATCE